MKKLTLPFVLFLQIVLLFSEVPFWVISSSLFFLIISFIPWLKSFKYIKLLTGIISVLVVIVSVQQFQFILSNELIASLLIILTSIRLIEHRLDAKEPAYFLYLLGLFLAVVKFVFQIDFIFGVYAFLATVFYLYQFFPENFRSHYSKESYRVLRKIIGYSLPVTVLLFLVFPQFKFDSRSQRNYGLFSTIGASGFSGELRPGSISELVNNENIAFRAEFTDFVPRKSELYWRGQVLDRPQGLMWRRSNPLSRAFEREENTMAYWPSYKVILEPHYKEQLFTLYETEEVEIADKILFSEKNSTFSLPVTLTDRLVYNGYVQLKTVKKLIGDRNDYLHLNRRSSKVEDLLKSLPSEAESKLTSDQKVKMIAKFFTDNHFEYRLSGQELVVNSIEEFLFKTKMGFCEHYASVAALLLRYWNVPSRVVVGYQGGEINQAGKFWTVKQQDAHAWVEYLNENDEWILFDPVTFVAPDRILQGASQFLNPLGSQQFFKQLGKRFEIFDQISNWAEIYNYRWTLFFVEYSSSSVKRDIIKFYDENEDVQLASQLILILIGINIIYRLFKKKIFKAKPLKEKYYSELHNFFKNRAPQQKNESFESWQKRIIEKYPSSHEAIDQIFRLYLKNRFGVNASQEEYKEFKSLLSSSKFQP